jgi:hypothetical protein
VTVISALGALRDGGHDVIVMHILDAAERTFPFHDASTFRDLETGVQLPFVPSKLRKEYVAGIEEHVRLMSKRLGENRIDHMLVDTSQPLDRLLFEYLVRRERMRTVK